MVKWRMTCSNDRSSVVKSQRFSPSFLFGRFFQQLRLFLFFIQSNAPREGKQLLCCCTAAVYRAGVTSNNRRSWKFPLRLRPTLHCQGRFTRENRSKMHAASRHAEPELLEPRVQSTECFLIVSHFEIILHSLKKAELLTTPCYSSRDLSGNKLSEVPTSFFSCFDKLTAL